MKYRIHIAAGMVLAAVSLNTNAWWGPMGAMAQSFFGDGCFNMSFSSGGGGYNRGYGRGGYRPYAYPAWGGGLAPMPVSPPVEPMPAPAWRARPTPHYPLAAVPQDREPQPQATKPFDGFDPFSMESAAPNPAVNNHYRQWMHSPANAPGRAKTRIQTPGDTLEKRAGPPRDEMRKWIDSPQSRRTEAGPDMRL